jgi:hypothetical protein
VIGFLSTQSADVDYKNFTVPFLQGLKEAGYVEGQNVMVEYRWAENQFDRLPALAADLVRRRITVIVATSNNASGGESSDCNHPDRIFHRRRPGCAGSCRQPQSAWRKRYRKHRFISRTGAKSPRRRAAESIGAL